MRKMPFYIIWTHVMLIGTNVGILCLMELRIQYFLAAVPAFFIGGSITLLILYRRFLRKNKDSLEAMNRYFDSLKKKDENNK